MIMSLNYTIAIVLIFASLVSIVLTFRYFVHYYSQAMNQTLLLEDSRRGYWGSGIVLVGSVLVLIAALGYLIVYSEGGDRARTVPTASIPATQQLTTDDTLVSPGSSAITPTTPPVSESTPTQQTSPVLQFARIGNTGGAGVNVRVNPGLGATILAQLSDDSQVTMAEGSQDVDGFTWQRVVLQDGRQGWIAVNFLIIEE